jgi:hypothetical protein
MDPKKFAARNPRAFSACVCEAKYSIGRKRAPKMSREGLEDYYEGAGREVCQPSLYNPNSHVTRNASSYLELLNKGNNGPSG